MINREFLELPYFAKTSVSYTSWTPRQIDGMFEKIEEGIQEDLRNGEETAYRSLGQHDPINPDINLLAIPGLKDYYLKTINGNVLVYPERHGHALAVRYAEVAQPITQRQFHRMPLDRFLMDINDIAREYDEASRKFRHTGKIEDFPKRTPNQEWRIPGTSMRYPLVLKHTAQMISGEPLSFWTIGNDQERLKKPAFYTNVRNARRRLS